MTTITLERLAERSDVLDEQPERAKPTRFICTDPEFPEPDDKVYGPYDRQQILLDKLIDALPPKHECTVDISETTRYRWDDSKHCMMYVRTCAVSYHVHVNGQVVTAVETDWRWWAHDQDKVIAGLVARVEEIERAAVRASIAAALPDDRDEQATVSDT